MSLIAGGARHPGAKFPNVGAKVKGTIIDFGDIPVTDFATGQPKFWNDGNPQMQTRVTLELQPGVMDSRVSLYVKGQMLTAIREAVQGAGSKDLEQFAVLGVERIADGQAKKGQQAPHNYTAEYEPPFDPTAGEPPF